MPAKKATPKHNRKVQFKKETPKKKLLSTKQKKFHLFMIHHDTGLTGKALMRKFNTKWAPAKSFIQILKENRIKIIIGDCDCKLHNKKLAEIFWEHGIYLWPGAGKGCGRHRIGYPPRSHDCNPCQNWFSRWQEDAAKLMKTKMKQNMFAWYDCLGKAQQRMHKSVWQKLIDTQPKVMKKIIANKGGRTKY